MYRLNIFCFCIAISMVSGCQEPEVRESVENDVPLIMTVADTNVVFSYEIFGVTDSMGVNHGFGYDIFQNSKRMIHQTTIPGEAGIDGFVSSEEAERVAKLVTQKMEAQSGFPTVNRVELDSLKITIQR